MKGYKDDSNNNASTNNTTSNSNNKCMRVVASDKYGPEKSTALVTRDLLGGLHEIESQELDLDLQVPPGWEKRLDLKVNSWILFLFHFLYFLFFSSVIETALEMERCVGGNETPVELVRCFDFWQSEFFVL